MLQLLSAPLQGGLRFFQFPLPATPWTLLGEAPASPGRRDVVATASDQTVTSLAGVARLLRTEPQVRLMFSYRTIIGISSFFSHRHPLLIGWGERPIKARSTNPLLVARDCFASVAE